MFHNYTLLFYSFRTLSFKVVIQSLKSVSKKLNSPPYLSRGIASNKAPSHSDLGISKKITTEPPP